MGRRRASIRRRTRMRAHPPRVAADADEWISWAEAVYLLELYLDRDVVVQVLDRPELQTAQPHGWRGPKAWRRDEIEAIVAELEAGSTA